MERRHWAAAQEVAERWRRHAHAVLARALREEAADDAATAAARLVRFLAKAGGRLRRGDLQRGLNLASAELDAALAAAGARVRTWEERTRGQPARWVALAPTAGSESPAATTEGTEVPHQSGAPPTSVVPVTTEVDVPDPLGGTSAGEER